MFFLKKKNKGISRTQIKFGKQDQQVSSQQRRKAWLWAAIVILVALVPAFFLTEMVKSYSKIFIGDNGGIFDTLGGLIKDGKLKGEKDDRINILVLGIRGEEDPHGGLLADTIMVISIKPSTQETAMISVPRDLYVKIPDYGDNLHKINSVHAIGEKEGENKGIEFMSKTVASVLNIPIHYTARANFEAFTKTVDTLGGVDINLEKPFSETRQWTKCDNGSCYHYDFILPAGDNHLDGDQALYYVRSRFSSSDFDRARRQQEVIEALKVKATDLGIVGNPKKVLDILGAVSDNVRTDMELWEVKRLAEIYKTSNSEAKQLVLDNASDGYLYSTSIGGAYALRPKEEDFGPIQEAAVNIFSQEENSEE